MSGKKNRLKNQHRENKPAAEAKAAEVINKAEEAAEEVDEGAVVTRRLPDVLEGEGTQRLWRFYDLLHLGDEKPFRCTVDGMVLEVLFRCVVVLAAAFMVTATAGGVQRFPVVVDVVGERMRVVAVRTLVSRVFGAVFL